MNRYFPYISVPVPDHMHPHPHTRTFSISGLNTPEDKLQTGRNKIGKKIEYLQPAEAEAEAHSAHSPPKVVPAVHDLCWWGIHR